MSVSKSVSLLLKPNNGLTLNVYIEYTHWNVAKHGTIHYNIFISIRKFNGTLYVSWLKGKYDVHLLSILGHEWIKNFFIQTIFRVGFIYFWIFEVQNIFLSKKGANCTWEEISTPPIGCV